MLRLMTWKPNIPSIAALILAATQVSAAYADDACADLDTLIQYARSDRDFTMHTLQFADLLESTPGECATVRVLGAGVMHVCRWEYVYRSPDARGAFEKLNEKLKSCFGERTQEVHDQGVNHPDFYDLRQYQIGDVWLSVSMKDKGALRKSYVSLRFQMNGSAK